MPDRINIPVSVTGAEQAKAELRGVAGAVQEVKQAGGASAGPPAAAEQQATAASAEGTTKAASATEQLIAKKRALATAVALAGGSFGAEVSQLGTLVSLLMTGGPLLAGVAAGLAALAVGAKVFNDIKRAAEEATRAQLEYNAAVAAGQAIKREEEQGIAESLDKFGARSEQNILAARQMQDKLRKDWGIPKERAGEAATLATATGVGMEDAVRIATLRGAGAQIETPDDAARALREARGQDEELLRQARRNAADAAGRAERQKAMAPNVGGRAEMSPERAAFEGMKEQPGGLAAVGLPANTTFEQFQAAARGQADAMAIARELHPGATKITEPQFEEAQAIARAATGAVKKYVDQTARIGAQGMEPEGAPGARGALDTEGLAVRHIVNNFNTTHITHNTHVKNIDANYEFQPNATERVRAYEVRHEGAGIEN